ncbi:MAG: 50S ribosomal protein L22, partial [Clostridia bacterium]
MATRISEKAKAREINADKRPRAIAKFIRISPDKVRIVLDAIRGKSLTEAKAVVKFVRK